jgi:hypothetical protein
MNTKKMILLFLISLGAMAAHAQAIDERVLGTWVLEGIEQQTLSEGVAPTPVADLTLPMKALMEEVAQKQPNHPDYPEDLPLLIYCFEENNTGFVGLCSTIDPTHVAHLSINDKGTFSTADGHIILEMNRGETPTVFDFTYQINDGRLQLTIDQPSRRTANTVYRRTITFRKNQ